MARALRIPARKNRWSDDELAAWAAEHPKGTPVRFWPVRGQAAFRDEIILSDPWWLGIGRPMVKISGISGGVALDHLRRIDAARAGA